MKQSIEIENAPGLDWRRRNNGKIVAYWIAKKTAEYRNFRPRTQLIWSDKSLPDETAVRFISDECQRLDAEQNDWRWRRHSKMPSRVYEGKGRVYFLSAAGLVKIGFTTNFEKRFAALQGGSPLPLSILGVVPGTPAREKEFHWLFADLRRHGEWFNLTDKLSRFIERECEKQQIENDVGKNATLPSQRPSNVRIDNPFEWWRGTALRASISSSTRATILVGAVGLEPTTR